MVNGRSTFDDEMEVFIAAAILSYKTDTTITMNKMVK